MMEAGSKDPTIHNVALLRPTDAVVGVSSWFAQESKGESPSTETEPWFYGPTGLPTVFDTQHVSRTYHLF